MNFDPTWTDGTVDNMPEHCIKERLDYLAQQAVALEQAANLMRLDRSRLLSRCCQSRYHKGWARPQEDREDAFDVAFNQRSITRKSLPARRIPWSERE
jgi:hypothetical protein